MSQASSQSAASNANVSTIGLQESTILWIAGIAAAVVIFFFVLKQK